MAFDWQEFLDLAEQLLESDSEAALRSAISRAYYSLFTPVTQRPSRTVSRSSRGKIQDHLNSSFFTS